MTAHGSPPSSPVPYRTMGAPTLPHAFVPSGRLVGRSRVEACDRCGLAQRGPGTMHPDHVCCMCPDQTPSLPCCNAGHPDLAAPLSDDPAQAGER